MLDALRGKQIDAAFMVNPFFNAAVTDAKDFQLAAAPYREVQPDVEVGHYISTQDYFAKNKETLAKYSRAFRKGVQWYNANLKDPDLVRIISGFTKMQPDLVAKLDLQRHKIGLHLGEARDEDRKSTRLNSSHQIISYAVFCLKKKQNN